MLLAGILLLASTSAGAQQTNPYQLSGSLSAGGTVSGGSYQIGAAMGQSNAGEASGGGYTLGGGVFGGGPVAQQQPPKRLIYLSLVQR
jgi:hypothetical protein